jgi:hypothetical protein
MPGQCICYPIISSLFIQNFVLQANQLCEDFFVANECVAFDLSDAPSFSDL